MDWAETNSGMSEGCGQGCADWQPLLSLYVAGDELDAAQQDSVRQHLNGCASCSAEVAKEQELLGMLAEHRVEPDAALLASCRAGLQDALDREEEGGWLRRKFGALLPSNWLSPEPVWSAALLVMIGFSVGLFGPRYLEQSARKPGAAHNPAMAVQKPGPAVEEAANEPVNNPVNNPVNDPGVGENSPTSELSSLDLHTADVAGINVIPAGGDAPPQVELQMRERKPITVQGTVADNNVERVLLYILRNNQRYDPDVRLNAVDLLRARNSDPDVRAALCRAVQTDQNAAVRLKALEALNGGESQEIVRNTLLGALVDDTNPGVRVEAINSIRAMAAKGQVASDEHMLAVLRDRMEHDPITYIRLQSAAAIRDLDPSQK
jgi:hypothetical protein